MRKALGFVILAGALLLGLQPVAAVKLFWSGKSGAYTWRWTDADITAGNRRTTLSLKKRLFPRWGKKEMEGLTYFSSDVKPLSLVGSLLSYERQDWWAGGAHPSGAISYATLDAARPFRTVKLTDLFPDLEVRDALWADSVVKRVAAREKIRTKPGTAAALVKALEFKSFGGDQDETYGFPDDLLERFAFHHMEGSRVAVRLHIPWGAEAYRGRVTQLGLLLRIPVGLRRPLQSAASGREGFLSRSVAARFKNKSAQLIEVGHE
jgi:hypothetical protein